MSLQLSVSDNQDCEDKKVLFGIKVYKEVNFMLNFPSHKLPGRNIKLPEFSALSKNTSAGNYIYANFQGAIVSKRELGH